MRVLIPTQVHDIHAKAVWRALATRGHEAVLWYGSDLPSRQTLSVSIDESGRHALEIVGAQIDACGPFDAVWLRRPCGVRMLGDMHPGDRAFSEHEWTRMLGGTWQTLAPEAFWVNPRSAAIRANDKAEQLGVAARHGLRIPATLMSNDPRRIRGFIRDNHARGRETIYKPFTTSQWRIDDDSTAYLFTSVVTEDELPEDEVLALCPGIFQPRLDKDHELRVTFIGEQIFVARLDSQSLDAARVDWRVGTRAIGIEEAALPPEVEARCRRVMADLGLVFACFDLIVTPTGEHVFLEINQMGQFLWLEELLPSLPLLDAFCELLMQGRPDFDWQREDARLRFADFVDEEADERIDAAHIAPRFTHLHEDTPESDERAA